MSIRHFLNRTGTCANLGTLSKTGALCLSPSIVRSRPSRFSRITAVTPKLVCPIEIMTNLSVCFMLQVTEE
jgi:hypothetical protein